MAEKPGPGRTALCGRAGKGTGRRVSHRIDIWAALCNNFSAVKQARARRIMIKKRMIFQNSVQSMISDDDAEIESVLSDWFSSSGF